MVFHGYSGLLPRCKNIQIRLSGYSDLLVGVKRYVKQSSWTLTLYHLYCCAVMIKMNGSHVWEPNVCTKELFRIIRLLANLPAPFDLEMTDTVHVAFRKDFNSQISEDRKTKCMFYLSLIRYNAFWPQLHPQLHHYLIIWLLIFWPHQ